MPTTTDTSRTAHLLALMKKGDDAFNARDFATVDTVHHPDMVAYIPGLAEPVYGKEAHAAAMQQFLRIFPDMHVYSDPYPIQFGSGDWITVVTNATGTFTGEMTLPDGTVIPPTGKAFDVEFGQTTKWDGDQLIVISAFYDAALQRQQIGLALAAKGPVGSRPISRAGRRSAAWLEDIASATAGPSARPAPCGRCDVGA